MHGPRAYNGAWGLQVPNSSREAYLLENREGEGWGRGWLSMGRQGPRRARDNRTCVRPQLGSLD